MITGLGILNENMAWHSVFFANNQVREPVLLNDLGPLVRYTRSTQSKVTKLECSLIHYIPTMHNRFQAL